MLGTCLPMQDTQGTWVQALGWEEPLGKQMATHSSILVWKIPCEPGRLQSMGSQRVGLDLVTEHAHRHIGLGPTLVTSP